MRFDLVPKRRMFSLTQSAAHLAKPHRPHRYFTAPLLSPRPIDRPPLSERRSSRPAPSAAHLAPPQWAIGRPSRLAQLPHRLAAIFWRCFSGPAPSTAPLCLSDAPLAPPHRPPLSPRPSTAPLCLCDAPLAPPYLPPISPHAVV